MVIESALSPSSRKRTTLYVLLLAIAAALLMFCGLGQRRLGADEAQYALITQNIRLSGQWLDITPYPPELYLQKPPLYMWLSAATYEWVGGPIETKFRVWSAILGVGCILLTCVIGATLLTPEVGLLAASVLLANTKFVNDHGARQGTMDTALTFFTLVAVLTFWRCAQDRLRAWILIGIAAGLMCLFKPLAGIPLLGLLSICTLTGPRDRWGARFRGLLIAAGVMLLIGAPWYLAMFQRHGSEFAHEMFGANLVGRIATAEEGNRQGPLFYARTVCQSSAPFWLTFPACAYVLWRSKSSPYAAAFRVIAVFSFGWMILYSLSASKVLHYIYPTFPFIALAIASPLAELTGRPRWYALAGYVLIGAIGLYFTLHDAVAETKRKYAPWEIYRTLSPAIARGEVTGLIFDLPPTQVEWRTKAHFDASDCFYVRQMQLLKPASDAERAALASGSTSAPPILALVVGKNPNLQSLRASGRVDDQMSWESDVLAITLIRNESRP